MYDINNCILIRKTTIFPENGVIETPIHGQAYGFGSSTILEDAINNKLREKYQNTDEFLQESKKYNVYFETYRRTIHFTINGVVSNSMYGEFNYPYAIIEPLKYHINDESLEGLRVEDTYFTDDMTLSDEAIILIPEEEKESLAQKYDLKSLNIHTYTGEIEEAIKQELQNAGYDFFVVNNHGYRDGLTSGTKDQEMYDFIQRYAEEHNISQGRHFYSDINHEDQMKRLEEGEKIDELHLKYILDSGLVSHETKDKVNNLLKDRRYYKKEFDELMSKVVDEVGLDNLAQLTNEFNKKMIKERELRKMFDQTKKEEVQTKEKNI